MKNINKFLEIEPFSLKKTEKKKSFNDLVLNLTNHHYRKSSEYRKLIDFFGFKPNSKISLEQLPYLPIRLFKTYDLISIKKKDIFKILNSSGTSGSKLSKIYLDKNNANIQVKVLNKIIGSILGNKRLPMLIIDKNPNKFNRLNFNARFAAIHGFSIFGKNYTYLLNEDGDINYNLLNDFLSKFGKKQFFIFGFTSLVYENLIKKINTKYLKNNLSQGILLHGGGWKKLEALDISNNLFKKMLFKKLKLKNVNNYYGLVEQAGSIFIECKNCNCFVASIFSDVFIRDKNFKIVKDGEKGLVQVISTLPTSYPGHNILTDDIGKIINYRNNKCKLIGKHFLIYGRAKNSEIRGCSDV